MGLLKSIGKFLFGGSKKSSKTETSGTTTSEPWALTVPHLSQYLTDTENLYGPNGADMFSPLETEGYDLLSNIIDADNGAIQPAIDENNKTLSGAYLDPKSNPYITEIANRLGGIASGTSIGQFGSGRSDSGLSSYYAGKGGADAASELYFNNYNNERSRMGSAVGMAPSLEQGRFLAPQALISAGQNVSSRPFDLNLQKGSILSSIAGLGGTTNSTGKATNYGYGSGLIGGIVNSFTNKLFPGVTPWPVGG
jgi:hypothetical protein